MARELPDSPVTLNPRRDGPEPIIEFVVLVGKWSGGTAALARGPSVELRIFKTKELSADR